MYLAYRIFAICHASSLSVMYSQYVINNSIYSPNCVRVITITVFDLYKKKILFFSFSLIFSQVKEQISFLV